jgi:hypothetical protein
MKVKRRMLFHLKREAVSKAKGSDPTTSYIAYYVGSMSYILLNVREVRPL